MKKAIFLLTTLLLAAGINAQITTNTRFTKTVRFDSTTSWVNKSGQDTLTVTKGNGYFKFNCTTCDSIVFNPPIKGTVAMVKITNADTALYGGTEIWLQYNGTDTLPVGVGKFYVPYYNKSKSGFGIYSPDSTYASGDTAIWGGKYWRNISGLNDSALNTFALDTHWTVIPYSSGRYRTVYDPIVYDKANNLIIERYEIGSGNKVITSQFINEYMVNFRGWENPIKAFQWGNEIDFDNAVNPLGIGDVTVNGSLMANINFTGSYMFNIKMCNKSVQRDFVFTKGSNQNSCLFDNNSVIIAASLTDSSRLRNLTLLGNSVINGLTMSGESVIEMCSYANQTSIADLVLDGQVITGCEHNYAALDYGGASSSGDAFGCSVGSNTIVYPIELAFDSTAGAGLVGSLNLFNYAFEDGFYIDNIVTNCDGLTYGGGAYITLGIETDDVDAGLTSTTGLCSTLDGAITRPTTALTYATAPRKLVAAVGGAAISDGTCNFLVTLKRP